MALLRTRLSKKTTIAALLVFIASFTITAYQLWDRYYPNSEHITPSFDGNPKPLFYGGSMLGDSAIGEKEGLKLPLNVVQRLIDPTVLYEEASESVIMTSKDKVIRMKTSELTALMNEKPTDLKFPVEKKNGVVYLPVEPLISLTSTTLRESSETGAVLLFKEGEEIQWGIVAQIPDKPQKTIPMREEPTIKAPILADLKQGDKVIVWSESEDAEWYKVQLTNGHMGYVQKSKIGSIEKEVIPQKPAIPNPVQWKPAGGKVNLTWEQVTTKNPDTSKIAPMTGLNVISPTWFHLQDKEGNLQNLADAAYVKWAQSQDLQVWALFSNGFDPERTSAALATYDKRMKMIKQLLGFAQLYKLQGINIDFENVYLKDKKNLTQFVREMTPLLHEQGLVVSMDVTAKSSSENWSMFYDRKALAETLDYMMVMTYDEHYAASPVAGSVASLPWVEKSITQIMKEDNVPASKLILGIPFYTRVWTEEPKDGKTAVSSRAIFMDTFNKTIAEKKLTPVFDEASKQNYVEYMDGEKKIRVWLEDQSSVKARIELVNKYNLAGVGSWRRGYETLETWETINSTLSQK